MFFKQKLGQKKKKSDTVLRPELVKKKKSAAPGNVMYTHLRKWLWQHDKGFCICYVSAMPSPLKQPEKYFLAAPDVFMPGNFKECGTVFRKFRKAHTKVTVF